MAKEEMYHIALDDYEHGIIIRSLNDEKTDLMNEGKSTDAVDDLIRFIVFEAGLFSLRLGHGAALTCHRHVHLLQLAVFRPPLVFGDVAELIQQLLLHTQGVSAEFILHFASLPRRSIDKIIASYYY